MKKINKGDSMKKLMSLALVALLGFTASTNAFLFWGRGNCCGNGWGYGYNNNGYYGGCCGNDYGCCGGSYGYGGGYGWGGFGGGYYGW